MARYGDLLNATHTFQVQLQIQNHLIKNSIGLASTMKTMKTKPTAGISIDDHRPEPMTLWRWKKAA